MIRCPFACQEEGLGTGTEGFVTDAKSAGARVLAGKCLCGAVHYEVADAFGYAVNCHCSRCRRATGSAFKAFAGIERDRLRITRGEDRLLIFGDADSNPHAPFRSRRFFSNREFSKAQFPSQHRAAASQG